MFRSPVSQGELWYCIALVVDIVVYPQFYTHLISSFGAGFMFYFSLRTLFFVVVCFHYKTRTNLYRLHPYSRGR